MLIQTNIDIIIDAGIESVFDASTDCQNLPKFFTGYKAIPAIVSAKTLDGLPLQEGSTRIVENGDGSCVEETIIALKRPHIQEYKLVKGLKPPFSWLVRSASGKWLYETTQASTKVNWKFEFELSNVFAYFLFKLLVEKDFEKAQEICLENIKKYLESGGR